MVYRSRFYKHTKARILKEAAKANNTKDKDSMFLTNAKDIREFLTTHYYSLEELR
jgi:hypothetical protein